MSIIVSAEACNMHQLFAFLVLSAAMCSASDLAFGKNITRYGTEASFWRNHVLVVGEVDNVEHRHGSEYYVSFRVDDCVPSRFTFGSRVEAQYNNAPNGNFGNLVEGLQRGDKVLVLLRPSYGRASLPSGFGESFAMMPGGAPLYRITAENDRKAADTINIFKAGPLGNLGEKTVAFDRLLAGTPSAHAKEFCVSHLNLLIFEMKSDIANAGALHNRYVGNLKAPPKQTTTLEKNAVRILARICKARMDGSQPQPSWPEEIRQEGTSWIVDLDTTYLPGGAPEQIVIDITMTGGHTGNSQRSPLPLSPAKRFREWWRLNETPKLADARHYWDGRVADIANATVSRKTGKAVAQELAKLTPDVLNRNLLAGSVEAVGRVKNCSKVVIHGEREGGLPQIVAYLDAHSGVLLLALFQNAG